MILGVIPARGGSTGVPRKNLRLVSGKPLIAHAIENGRACKRIDKLMVSTDSEEIAKVAESAGAWVPFIRPFHLAQNDSPMLAVLEHALLEVELTQRTKISAVVLIDPTAPLRMVQDLDQAIALFERESPDAVISGTPAKRNPYFNMVEENNGFFRLVKKSNTEITRRQDCPKVYDLNTVVWIFSREAIIEIRERIPPKTLVFEVPEARAIDLDTEQDFKRLESVRRYVSRAAIESSKRGISN